MQNGNPTFNLDSYLANDRMNDLILYESAVIFSVTTLVSHNKPPLYELLPVVTALISFMPID